MPLLNKWRPTFNRTAVFPVPARPQTYATSELPSLNPLINNFNVRSDATAA